MRHRRRGHVERLHGPIRDHLPLVLLLDARCTAVGPPWEEDRVDPDSRATDVPVPKVATGGEYAGGTVVCCTWEVSPVSAACLELRLVKLP